jgi:hypothetical protein
MKRGGSRPASRRTPAGATIPAGEDLASNQIRSTSYWPISRQIKSPGRKEPGLRSADHRHTNFNRQSLRALARVPQLHSSAVPATVTHRPLGPRATSSATPCVRLGTRPRHGGQPPFPCSLGGRLPSGDSMCDFSLQSVRLRLLGG